MPITGDFQKEVYEQTRIRFGENCINLPEHQAATESFSDFVLFLFERDYLTKNDLPIESGWRRFLLNTEPIHQGGQEMTRPRKIAPNIFLERNYNKKGIKRKMRYLYRISQNETS